MKNEYLVELKKTQLIFLRYKTYLKNRSNQNLNQSSWNNEQQIIRKNLSGYGYRINTYLLFFCDDKKIIKNQLKCLEELEKYIYNQIKEKSLPLN